jgi:hypothetical protein
MRTKSCHLDGAHAADARHRFAVIEAHLSTAFSHKGRLMAPASAKNFTYLMRSLERFDILAGNTDGTSLCATRYGS